MEKQGRLLSVSLDFLSYEFLEYSHPSLNWDTSITANRGVSHKSRTESKGIDPSQLNLYCLQTYLLHSTGL